MKLQRSLSTLSVLFISVTCMVGSGWLFGAFYAARIAGPASVVSWLLGAVLILFIALVFAELATMLPISGGIARYTQFSHGSMVSFSMGWLAWLSCVAVAPTEVQAILQYSATYFPNLVKPVDHTPVLTGQGIGLAVILMAVMSYLNTLAIKVLARINNWITFWKLIIPLIVCAVIAFTRFNGVNFFGMHASFTHFSPAGWHGVLWALPTAGIVFSFLGFREATSLAGEAKLPGRAIPVAVIGSVILGALFYVFIQLVFVGALDSSMLKNGWQALVFSGDAGPFAGLAMALGLSALLLLIYADSLISPFGTGLAYTATTSRLNYAMSISGHVPKFMQQLNKQGVPHKAVWINFLVGLLLFLPFPTWQALVSFQSVAIVLAYSAGPVALLVLRQQAPQQTRPFRLPCSKLMALLTFYSCNLIAYWTGWQIIYHLMISIAIGLIIFVSYHYFVTKDYQHLRLKTAWWLLLHFAGLALISYLGNFGGGLGIIHFGMDFLVIFIYSIVLLYLAYRSMLDKSVVQTLLALEEIP